MKRRTFLELLSSLALSALSACSVDDVFRRGRPAGASGDDPTDEAGSGINGGPEDPPRFGNNPFHLGIASGDPKHDRVMIWTRLVAEPEPLRGSAFRVDELATLGPVPVEWLVATDAKLTNIVRRGAVVARPETAHCVRVDVDGLSPASTYFYAFRAGQHMSKTGRTKTLPAPDAQVDKIRFAIASCQNWQEGQYAAHAHLADEDIDFVVFLGDYIYEEGIREGNGLVRRHDGDAPHTLAEYRRRYALYKTDPNLQAAHAAHPWIAIWDDHEVAGNYAAEFSTETKLSIQSFLDRRAAAYEAYWEHLPLRAPSPIGPTLDIYRDFKIGTLARLVMLDGRQYRSKPPCDGKVTSKCDDRDSPTLSMLGTVQEKWMLDTLTQSKERWKLIGNGTMMAPTAVLKTVNTDQWDGFTQERQRLFNSFAGIDGQLVVMTGDIHATVLSELPRDADRPESAKVGVEIVTTSLSSSGVPSIFDMLAKAVGELMHMKYVNVTDKGYLICELTHERLTTTLRAIKSSNEVTSSIRDTAVWTVEHGSSKLEEHAVPK